MQGSWCWQYSQEPHYVQTGDPPDLQGLEPGVFWSWRGNLQRLGVCQSL